jgi:nicotinamide mononucleotide (NMN) deamidase PncC
LQRLLGNRVAALALQRMTGDVRGMSNGRAGLDPLFSQRSIGNRATALAIQREFEDQGEQLNAPQPVLEEAASGAVQAEGVNPFGEVDGAIGSNVVPHAMSNKGQTGTELWHHAGGGRGGTGNQNTGSADLVAPVYKSKPATAKKPAKAWIEGGTGKVKVTRSYVGVKQGNNGEYKHSPGLTWITWKAKWRIAKHEREHIKVTRQLHQTHIQPLEKRLSKYRGITGKRMDGVDEAAAITALQAHVDWNTAVNGFANDDTTQNTPMGPVDTTDLAKPDFYFDFGPKLIKKVQYGHYTNTN